MKYTFKVLISDVHSRKGMDVVNIMQQCYEYDCILAAPRNQNFQLPIIYGQQVFQLRNVEYGSFKTDLRQICDHFPDDLIIYLPVSEELTRLFIQFIDGDHPDNLRWHLPSLETFNLTSNKGAFQDYCEKQGHPVPRSFDENNIHVLRTDFRPAMLKPKSGQGSVGIRYYNDSQELPSAEDINWEEYIVQEKVESDKKVAGAFFLAQEGKVLNSYCHQRLRTFPPEGGVTVYSKSVYYPEILEIGVKLLKDLKWNGLAMIEFMYDEQSDEWKIIEVNPRIWGSVLLSAFNQSGMLQNYVNLIINEPVNAPVPSTLPPVYIRWIYPFDVLNFLKGELNWRQFFALRLKKTCYVNFTYSTVYRSFAYLLYFTFNFRSIRRFLKKLRA